MFKSDEIEMSRIFLLTEFFQSYMARIRLFVDFRDIIKIKLLPTHRRYAHKKFFLLLPSHLLMFEIPSHCVTVRASLLYMNQDKYFTQLTAGDIVLKWRANR